MGRLENSYKVDPDLVKKELLQILSSEKFRNAQVLSMFLQFVVEETLAGRVNEIKEYTIGIRALGRSPDFNPQADAAVRIHAGRLRRMLDEYFDREGSNDIVVIEMPKGGYVPVFKYKGERSMAHVLPAKTEPVIHRKATVAVYPFHNRSAEDSKNFFVAGLGEQLCNDLARFEHISVISYEVTEPFSSENRGIDELRQAFSVDFILTGSVRFSSGLVQISIQLMQAETDMLLWTHTYLRHYNNDNLYNIQDEIVEQVVNKVADSDGVIIKNIGLWPASKRQNLFGVFDALYIYFNLRGKYDQESFRLSLSVLERAVAVETESALLWSQLAKLYFNNYIFKTDPYPQDLVRGKAYTEKAIWLDQNSQYAHKLLAWSYLLTGDKEKCFEAIELCLDLNSKAPSVNGSMGFILICIGKYGLGFRLLLKAMHYNPVMPWYCNLGFALYYLNADKYEDAFNWTQRSGTPDMPLLILVRLAAASKMSQERGTASGKEVLLPEKQLTLRANQIIRQFIYDEGLRRKIMNGLLQAGLVLD